ncbi:Gls24 family general stress protein [Streptococcus pyogenes]|nr:Gls24 family general stress protein [Streptococcus pyogenes]
MTTEYIGEIVISPRVLEVITGIATTQVEGVHSLHNKKMADSFNKASLGKGVYLQTEEDGSVAADIYVYLQYGVKVPTVSMAIQKTVKSAVYDMAEVPISAVKYPC